MDPVQKPRKQPEKKIHDFCQFCLQWSIIFFNISRKDFFFIFLKKFQNQIFKNQIPAKATHL
jgi:hypothetical protein